MPIFSTIIIPLYKDLEALELVLNSLRNQTRKDFEILIAEDDDDPRTKTFLKHHQDLNIKHISQPDTGRNKVKIQNKAICEASGEYLFFIDGDILPFTRFVEYSLKLAKRGRILSGRRVNLDEETSRRIRLGEIRAEDIEKHYFRFALRQRFSRELRWEQGIQLNPNSLLYRLFFTQRSRNTEILGCNFSCFKSDIAIINGFDEDYSTLSTIADDTDLSWRFRKAGMELYSSKNIANCFHLWHKHDYINDDPENIKRYNELVKAGRYYCKNGLDKYCQLKP